MERKDYCFGGGNWVGRGKKTLCGAKKKKKHKGLEKGVKAGVDGWADHLGRNRGEGLHKNAHLPKRE